MEQSLEYLIKQLPYGDGFLFADEILAIDSEQISGEFHFHKGLNFYESHFQDHPVTPGVILIECCAQIGLACFGIYLSTMAHEAQKTETNQAFALVASDMEFFSPVYPGTKVRVSAQKEYFRFGKLKVKVKMENEKGELICKGTLAGMRGI
ncbi:3-hydroxyacyl-[acyl-carrier-protein] dehydratase [Robiginitalea myxolifaciens]|uniref:3-hydroxyacyl-[acyl-carrier-protein] dehydratase n=1 Tax=Robiginitalea myxolifaciens TaxID=400055 RepID=A0A1I6GYJ8_9FLAO|nr:hypothetical protein [Robiginitalea myxolifaciens]SFR47302.1 3-hydroxyacyl-[acyl-carrier-protein] dehydratase [Robiginitalea myxolifaciens]